MGKDSKIQLADILEIKQKYYVGTGQAVSYLRAMEYFRKHPDEFCSKINSTLKIRNYLATPARVIGVCNIIEEARTILHKYHVEYELENDALAKESANEYSLKHLSLNEYSIFIMDKENIYYDDLNETIEKLLDIFEMANENKVIDDNEFRKFLNEKYIMSRLEGQSDAKIAHLEEKLDCVCKNFNEAYERSKTSAEEIIFDRFIDSDRIISRMTEDQVTGKWEYRHKVINHVLERYFKLQTSEGDDFSCESTDDVYQRITKHLESLLEIDVLEREILPNLLESLEREFNEESDENKYTEFEELPPLPPSDKTKRLSFYKRMILSEDRYVRSKIRMHKRKLRSHE